MNHVSRMASSRASARPITSRPTSSARPITSTGLIAPKSSRGKTGLKRQIQDKTYFIGLLRSKINQLNAEITKLTKECENLADRESRTTIYKRKAEELAKELAVLNRELGVYNEFNERLRTNQDENEIKEDIKELKLENNKQNQLLEINYENKKQLEEMIKREEEEMKRVQNDWNKLKDQMSPELKLKYDNLEKINQELNMQCEQLESEIAVWKEKKNKIETNADSKDSLVRREIILAANKLSDLEKQRDDLLSDSNHKGDERGHLLAQVKRDNREISNMEMQIHEINKQIDDIKSDLEVYDDVNAMEKFKDMKKKEEIMNNFLNDFDGIKKEEIEKKEIIKAEINELTEKQSKYLQHIETLKSQNPKNNQDKNSLEILQDEKRKLELDFNKIQQLEAKINSELISVETKTKNYQSEIEMYSDIPKLKSQIEEKINNLEIEKLNLDKTIADLERTNQKVKSQLEQLKIELNSNEMNKRLQRHEESLSELFASNESLKSIINTGVNSLKSKVMEEVKKYNQSLLGY